SALLCAGAGVAASDPTAATKAPAMSAVSVRLDISVPPIAVGFATCAVAVWRAVRRAFPEIRPDNRKGYASAAQFDANSAMPIASEASWRCNRRRYAAHR